MTRFQIVYLHIVMFVLYVQTFAGAKVRRFFELSKYFLQKVIVRLACKGFVELRNSHDSFLPDFEVHGLVGRMDGVLLETESH